MSKCSFCGDKRAVMLSTQALNELDVTVEVKLCHRCINRYNKDSKSKFYVDKANKKVEVR